MWICMSDGFVSIVQYEKDLEFLLVRARDRESLDQFVMLLDYIHPDEVTSYRHQIRDTPDHDYRFRVKMHRAHVVNCMEYYIRVKLIYPNFKNSVRIPKLHDAFTDIWSVMAAHYGAYGDEGSDDLNGRRRRMM